MMLSKLFIYSFMSIRIEFVSTFLSDTQNMTLANIAGGLEVMKSKTSPLTPLPSLSKRIKGRSLLGPTSKLLPILTARLSLQEVDGNAADMSVPMVVVPVDCPLV